MQAASRRSPRTTRGSSGSSGPPRKNAFRRQQAIGPGPPLQGGSGRGCRAARLQAASRRLPRTAEDRPGRIEPPQDEDVRFAPATARRLGSGGRAARLQAASRHLPRMHKIVHNSPMWESHSIEGEMIGSSAAAARRHDPRCGAARSGQRVVNRP